MTDTDATDVARFEDDGGGCAITTRPAERATQPAGKVWCEQPSHGPAAHPETPACVWPAPWSAARD